MERGLEILAKVRARWGAGAHRRARRDADRRGRRVVDVLQTPAFLCRQTDFIRAVAQSASR
jgi:2-dehydro-3-deoxyphosphooctonate aldolase (KDO 8-P synthase)